MSKIQELYRAACERRGDERDAFLNEACGHDRELLREVQSLLAQDASGLFEHSATVAAAPRSNDTLPRRWQAGTLVGPYRIERLLGEGGMGDVYKARDTRLGRDVALKTAKQEFSGRFQREARAISALNHPGICTLYDVGPDYLVMEYIEGTPVRGPLPVAEAIRLGIQIAAAVRHAHQHGVVHRDLKPGNILVTRSGVKVLDFGLAKLERAALAGFDVMGTHTMTQQGAIVGTLRYMPPEQLKGLEADARSDVFAFGVVLYEMLTGKPPFHGSTQAELIASLLKGEAPPVRSLAPEVPPALDHLIRTCLAKDPEERRQSMQDVLLELEWMAGGETSGAAQPLSAGKRRAWPWKAGFAVAVALMAGVGVGLLARRAPTVASSLIHITEDPPAPLAELASAGPGIALSPDGARIVYRSAAVNGLSHLTMRRLDQQAAVDLAGTDGARAMFFSSDSRWIGYVTPSGIFKIPADGGAPVFITKPPVEARGFSWGADGALIFGSIRGPLFRISDSGGDPVPLTKLERGEVVHRWPTRSPRGEWVFFAAGGTGAYNDATLAAVSLRTGERKTVFTGGTFPILHPSGLLFFRAGVLYSLQLDQKLQPATSPRALLSDIASVLSTGAYEFTVADAGNAAYIPGWLEEEHPGLTWMRADGTIQSAAPAGSYGGPRLSPDRKKVVLRLDAPAGPEFYVRDLALGAMTQLTSDGKRKSGVAVWTPNGRFVVFGGEAAGVGVYAVPSDASAQPRRVLETPALFDPGSFSGDGKRLLLTNGNKIFTAPAEVDQSVRLGKPEPFIDGGPYPCFSPDGRWVIYSLPQSGVPQVFARRYPDAGFAYEISAAGGNLPAWPSGDRLYFNSQGRLMSAVCSAQSGSFRCDPPRQVSNQRMARRGATPNFDAAGDGSVLAITPSGNANPGPPRVHFLLHFLPDGR